MAPFFHLLLSVLARGLVGALLALASALLLFLAILLFGLLAAGLLLAWLLLTGLLVLLILTHEVTLLLQWSRRDGCRPVAFPPDAAPRCAAPG